MVIYCELYLQAEGMPPMEWQIGRTKLFLRGRVHEPLEDRRLALINAAATTIQKVWKGQRTRKDFLRKRAAAKKIQVWSNKYSACRATTDTRLTVLSDNNWSY